MIKGTIFLTFALFSLVFSQQQISNSQRFILYEISSINDMVGIKDVFPEPNPVGENKNIILLDSYTGETWILSGTLQPPNQNEEKPLMLLYHWLPIYFDDSDIFNSDGLDIHRGMSKKPTQ